jgi:HSP20 family protein
MTIIRFNPFALQKQFFQPIWDEDEWPELTMTDGLNVYEEAGNVFIEASVPGIPEDKLEITYEDGVLRIQGKMEETEEEKKKNKIVHRMQRIASFNYSTYLPRPIDEKKIEATVKNGVLTVKAPVAEAAKPKRIQVKTK